MTMTNNMKFDEFYVEIYDADNLVGTETIMYPSLVYHKIYEHTHSADLAREAEKFCDDCKVGDEYHHELFMIRIV